MTYPEFAAWRQTLVKIDERGDALP